MAEKNPSTQVKRPPILGIFLMFLIPIALIFVYLQNRQISGEGGPAAVQPKRDVEAQLTQVKLIRDKWQVWASAHKQELSALKLSSGDNAASYQKVFDQIPMTLTPETGLTAEDLMSASAEDPLHKHTKWDWLMKQKSLLNASAQSAAMAKNEIAEFKAMMEEDRTFHRDCRILKSINGGTSNLFLWSSGRVTEGVREKELKSGIMVLNGVVKHTEKIPAFNFVK